MICPKCGENNADNFRFCGMCGSILERTPPASPPRLEVARESALPVSLTIPANPPKAGTDKRVEAISGPSILGIGEPSLDSLREKAFSGADSFFEPEEPKTGGRKVLLLVLLAALGAAIWWTYTNYIAIGSTPRQPAAASNGGTTAPAENAPTPQPAPEVKSADPAKTPPSPAAETPTPAAETPAPAAEKTPVKPAVEPASNPPVAARVTAPKPRAPEKAAAVATMAKTDQRTPIRSDRSPAPAPKAALTVTASDTGDAAFRKGEAYLYGRGVTENCDEAVKNLKAASAKQNARARSTFGTMYATGHCVPRDLPTSYVWFALALRVDPNNQILEKDLSAIWNQMTPPERQLATKMKQ